jgi:hypothetical protein
MSAIRVLQSMFMALFVSLILFVPAQATPVCCEKSEETYTVFKESKDFPGTYFAVGTMEQVYPGYFEVTGRNTYLMVIEEAAPGKGYRRYIIRLQFIHGDNLAGEIHVRESGDWQFVTNPGFLIR